MLDVDLTALTPLAGGWSDETFLGRVGAEQVVVRVYGERASRGEVSAQVDAALLRLVRGLVPVADVLEVRPGLLVTSLVPGVRGDELLADLDEAGRRRVGQAVGDLLATLGGMPALGTGPFVDASLAVGSFGGRPTDGLPEFLDEREGDLAHLSPVELEGLRELVVDAQALLDTVERRCLVHSDLNPKNLMLDPETLTVTALLDWEFAHAGHPFTDLGNVLRFDRDPAYADAVLERYVERRGGSADRALALGRAADLFALVDLATRRHSGPVAARADRLLRAVARQRDPGADLPD